LAHGLTRLSLYKNVLAVALLVPLMMFLVMEYGAVGAAVVWVILNGGYFLIEIPIMHRLLLRGEMRAWYLTDVGLPLCAALVVGLAARLAVPAGLPKLATLSWLLTASAVTYSAAALAAPFPRWVISEEWLRRFLRPGRAGDPGAAVSAPLPERETAEP
jgi:hypothetical protein